MPIHATVCLTHPTSLWTALWQSGLSEALPHRQAQGINAEKPLASLTTSREATSFGLFSLLDRLEAYRTTGFQPV